MKDVEKVAQHYQSDMGSVNATEEERRKTKADLEANMADAKATAHLSKGSGVDC